MSRSTFYDIEYIQKSIFLFPLLHNQTSKYYKDKLIKTYLFGDFVQEDILDMYLICEFKKGIVLDEDISEYLYKSQETEEGNDLCIFNISKWEQDIEKFLKGEYSKFSEEHKKRILSYFNYPENIEKLSKREFLEKVEKGNKLQQNGIYGNFNIYVVLYPYSFKEEVAKEMVERYDLYNNVDEAMKALHDVEELLPIYDHEKETFKKNII